MSEPVAAVLGGTALTAAGVTITTAEDTLLRLAAVALALTALAVAAGRLFVMFRRLLDTLESIQTMLSNQHAEAAFVYAWFRAWSHNVRLVQRSHAEPWAADLITDVPVPPHLRVFDTDPYPPKERPRRVRENP